MLSISHKISAVIMSIMVLMSTMTMVINTHYCGDVLVDRSIFHEADSCGMEQSSEMGICEMKKKNCCTNDQLVIDGQDELKINFDELDSSQRLFVASFVYSYLDLFEGLSENVVPYSYYEPPLVVRDIQVLDEVYLI